MSTVSTLGELGDILHTEGPPIPEGGFKVIQSKSSASTPSPLLGKEFTIDVERVKTPTIPEPITEQPFPEGGIAGWATVVGAFIVQFCGFGYGTSFGVFQDFYVREYLTNESSSSIAWIGSLNSFLLISGGLIAGRVYDRGHFYALLWGGSALISFSLFMLSLTQKNHYYQIFLCQGIGVGIGIGMIYVPSVAVLSHYFRRRRNLVMTIVTVGSSAGAVVHPIMLNNTIPKIGFAKATRANAGLISGLLLIACLIMKTRLPPPTRTPDLKKSVIKFSKDPPYIACTFGFFFFVMSFFYPVFYLQLDSINHHLGTTFSFYVLVILNGCSFIGRIFAGVTGTSLGLGRLIVITTAVCSVTIFCMFAVSNVASVVGIAATFGFFSGAYVSLMAPLVANLSDNLSEIGLRMGVGFTFAGLGGFIGSPIAGALLTTKFIWWRATVFSGIMSTVGCFCFVMMEILLHRKKRRQAEAKEIS